MAVIFVSACVALYETVMRFIHPEDLTHLWILAAAGAIGFVGNELAAQVRLRGGKRLSSPALIADGKHARVDGFVSLGVVGSAIVVSLGAQIGDPIIGLVITLVILTVTWDAVVDCLHDRTRRNDDRVRRPIAGRVRREEASHTAPDRGGGYPERLIRASTDDAHPMGRDHLGMYGDHMDGGWWAWMAIMPVLLVVVVAFAVYLAVRLGIRDGHRDTQN